MAQLAPFLVSQVALFNRKRQTLDPIWIQGAHPRARERSGDASLSHAPGIHCATAPAGATGGTGGAESEDSPHGGAKEAREEEEEEKSEKPKQL